MNREQIDLLIWEYIDETISAEDLVVLTNLIKTDPAIDEEVRLAREFHLSMKNLPVNVLSPSFQKELKKKLLSQPKKKAVSWSQLSFLLVMAAATLLYGLYSLFQNFKSFEAIEPQVSSPLTVFNIEASYTWMESLEFSNMWVCSVVMLIIPLVFVVDKAFLQRRSLTIA